jgi:hypothetical protein
MLQYPNLRLLLDSETMAEMFSILAVPLFIVILDIEYPFFSDSLMILYTIAIIPITKRGGRDDICNKF